MKNLITSIVFTLVIVSSSFAQSLYDSPASAAQKVGQEVAVVGKVINTYYTGKDNGGIVFINLDAAYPNNAISVIVPRDARVNFPLMTEIEGRKILVKGKLKSGKDGKPCLYLNRSKQLSILEDLAGK